MTKIFLVGMMGSGKTYWMNRLAKKLDLPRYDLDSLIEGVEDRSIMQIFKESGEEHFRKMESIVLKWFADKDNFILATGGGTPCFHHNMEWMNKQGLTVWLDEPVEVLVKRLLPERSQRPLIENLNRADLEVYLEAKKSERINYYQQARVIINGADINEDAILSSIKPYINA